MLVRSVAEAEKFTFVVTVMGAQHLPKRGGAESGDIPSPSCSVIMYGVRTHTYTLWCHHAYVYLGVSWIICPRVQDAVDTVKYKTSVVASNGFNPVWQERVVFKVYRPDTCFLYIAVHDWWM
jgi:hypothetical protein